MQGNQTLKLLGFCSFIKYHKSQGVHFNSRSQIAKALNMSRTTIIKMITQLKEMAKQPDEHFLKQEAEDVLQHLGLLEIEYLKACEAAELLGVTTQTIYRRIQAGLIHAKFHKMEYLIPKQEIEKLSKRSPNVSLCL